MDKEREDELIKEAREGVYGEEEPVKIFTVKGQAQKFDELQPYFYDKTGMFWLWNNKLFCWEACDEVDLLNMIEDGTGQDVISSKARTEIINAMKQRGRKNIPEPIKPTWIQFKDKIYDIETAKSFNASPKYFVTNPIPWNVSGDPRTPNIDRIFKEWVGEDYTQTLYEILAYCLLPDYPLNRLFCFIGSGMNGKSKFFELLQKFVGVNNICSTELDTLLTSRFEITRLHKKLVCQMGETNFNEMSRTSMLKKLTGGDLIGFEYKRKDHFEDKNYAKILIATNNLPTTTDKTMGFYRRWMIIDFPNTFSEKKEILDEIPEEEYNNLATNSIIILNQLLKKREFHKEGTIEERKERYEAKSNFLEQFIESYTLQDVNDYITKAEFARRFRDWCKDNRHREMSDTAIGTKMNKLGMESSKRTFNWMNDGKGGQARTWEGIKWRDSD